MKVCLQQFRTDMEDVENLPSGSTGVVFVAAGLTAAPVAERAEH